MTGAGIDGLREAMRAPGDGARREELVTLSIPRVTAGRSRASRSFGDVRERRSTRGTRVLVTVSMPRACACTGSNGRGAAYQYRCFWA